jgi:hypothetical protein
MFSAIFLAAVVSCNPPVSAQRLELPNVPAGWTATAVGTRVDVISAADGTGAAVRLTVPLAKSFNGDFKSALGAVSNEIAAGLRVSILEQSPVNEIRVGSGVYVVRYLVSNTGVNLILHIYGREISPSSPKQQGQVQLAALLAPQAIAVSPTVADQRWSTAVTYVTKLLVEDRFALVAGAGGTTPAKTPATAPLPSAPTATIQAAQQPPLAQANVWSLRTDGRGLTLSSPCEIGGGFVIGWVGPRTYEAWFNDPANWLTVDSAAMARQLGASSMLEAGPPATLNGNIEVARSFTVDGRKLVALVLLRKSGNYVQQGLVLAPLELVQSNDPRVGDAAQRVRDLLVQERTPDDLALDGTSPSGGAGIAAVVRLSGLADASLRRKLRPGENLVTLYWNGTARTATGVTGTWRRSTDGTSSGYLIEFSGADGIRTFAPDSCVAPGSVTAQPAAASGSRPSAPVAGAAAGSSGRNCGFRNVTVTNYAIYCGVLPGSIAPRTCPNPTSTIERQWVCD